MPPSQGGEEGPIPFTRSLRDGFALAAKLSRKEPGIKESDRRSQARDDLGEPGLEEISAEIYRERFPSPAPKVTEIITKLLGNYINVY